MVPIHPMRPSLFRCSCPTKPASLLLRHILACGKSPLLPKDRSDDDSLSLEHSLSSGDALLIFADALETGTPAPQDPVVYTKK